MILLRQSINFTVTAAHNRFFAWLLQQSSAPIVRLGSHLQWYVGVLACLSCQILFKHFKGWRWSHWEQVDKTFDEICDNIWTPQGGVGSGISSSGLSPFPNLWLRKPHVGERFHGRMWLRKCLDTDMPILDHPAPSCTTSCPIGWKYTQAGVMKMSSTTSWSTCRSLGPIGRVLECCHMDLSALGRTVSGANWETARALKLTIRTCRCLPGESEPEECGHHEVTRRTLRQLIYKLLFLANVLCAKSYQIAIDLTKKNVPANNRPYHPNYWDPPTLQEESVTN